MQLAEPMRVLRRLYNAEMLLKVLSCEILHVQRTVNNFNYIAEFHQKIEISMLTY